MKATTLALTATLLGLAPFASRASESVLHLPFQQVVRQAEKSGKLDGHVKFYLAGDAPAGKVTVIQTDAITNKKTNGFGKSDRKSCNWALTSALITLQNSAEAAGANAVVDVVSFYKRKTYSSPTDYECHAGFLMSGVALKASYAKVQ